MTSERHLQYAREDLEPFICVSPTPYSFFSSSEKWWIVLLVAFAGWFSTLSSFIYLPAIPLLAKSLHASVAQVELTVTSHLMVSGIAPSIVGNAAELIGRRTILVAALSIYIVSNVGLAVQRSILGLLFLRMLQSAGISGTIRFYPSGCFFLIPENLTSHFQESTQ